MLLSKCRTCGERHRLGPCPDSGRPTDKAPGKVPEKAVRVRRDKAGSSPAPESNEVHRESSSGDQDAPVSGGAASAGPKQSAEISDGMLQGPPLTPASSPMASPSGSERDAPLEGDDVHVVPLTPAEKQQRHRDKVKVDPVKYAKRLAADRLRKRK